MDLPLHVVIVGACHVKDSAHRVWNCVHACVIGAGDNGPGGWRKSVANSSELRFLDGRKLRIACFDLSSVERAALALW